MITSVTLNKMLTTIAMATFLFVAIFGVFHMNMSMDGKMTGCPFAPGETVCSMTPIGHISAVQSLLNILQSQKSSVYFLLLNILSISLLALFIFKYFSPPKNVLAYSRINNRDSNLATNFLQQAYSNGILNSKTF